MSSLFLIRHGQASFGADNYDVLSDLGVEQARRLGRYLARTPLALDALFTGPLTRQVDTARHLRDGAREAGVEYPEAGLLPDLDEYPAFEIVGRAALELVPENPRLGAALSSPMDSREFELAFGAIMKKWATGEIAGDDIESFAAFTARVTRGLETIAQSQGRGRRVAAITSGGPISIALMRALDLSTATTMRMAPVIANTAITELRYRDAEMTLFGFNALPHLADPGMITYR